MQGRRKGEGGRAGTDRRGQQTPGQGWMWRAFGVGDAGEMTPELAEPSRALKQECGPDEAPNSGGQGESAGTCKMRAKERAEARCWESFPFDTDPFTLNKGRFHLGQQLAD